MSINLIERSQCWMRQIEVRLYSKLKLNPIVYGGIDPNQLNISITGQKKVASAQDSCTVAISNLTYEEIVKIQFGEYYIVEIWAGYRTGDMYCYFSGEIAYISNKISARRDYVCYLICASRFMASFTQPRINFNCNSSINLYTAYKEIFKKANIKDYTLSPELKNKFLSTAYSGFGTVKTLAEQLAGMNNYGLDITTDSSAFGKVIDISTTTDKRRILLNQDNIIFRSGNPTLDSNGLKISLMPTFDYMPGDIIILDNAIIDISETTLSGAQKNYKQIYFDTSFSGSDNPTLGAYMIRNVVFNFQNRGDSFEINVTAKALSIVENILGENE